MTSISIQVTLEEGESVMAGECPVCGWRHEMVMTVGDGEREDAYWHLNNRHENTGCSHRKLNFNEHDST